MIRIALFVEENAAFHMGKELGCTLDYGKLVHYCTERLGGVVVLKQLYSNIPEILTEEQKKAQLRFLKSVENKGYNVFKQVTKVKDDCKQDHSLQLLMTSHMGKYSDSYDVAYRGKWVLQC